VIATRTLAGGGSRGLGDRDGSCFEGDCGGDVRIADRFSVVILIGEGGRRIAFRGRFLALCLARGSLFGIGPRHEMGSRDRVSGQNVPAVGGRRIAFRGRSRPSTVGDLVDAARTVWIGWRHGWPACSGAATARGLLQHGRWMQGA
jgi:hypothetical protein